MESTGRKMPDDRLDNQQELLLLLIGLLVLLLLLLLLLPLLLLLLLLRNRHRTSTMSLTFRVRRDVVIAMKPCTDCKSPNSVQLEDPLPFPQVTSGSVQ